MAPTSELRISAVIKARNEAHQIAEAVEAAFLLADEVLVVDDNSADATAAIATAAGARVVPGVPHGGRIDLLDKEGFERASGTWIVRLDADERMTAHLAAVLRAVAMEDEVDGCVYARRHVMFGGWALYGGWGRPQHLGFFRKSSYDNSWSADLHSQVRVRGVVRKLDDPEAATVHLDYDNVAQFVDRSLLNYAQTEARERLARGQRPRLGLLLPRIVKRFLGRYVLRQGYRDGRRGFVLAALLVIYDFFVEAYMWDGSRTAKEAPNFEVR